jgi:hypothetical protein
MIGIEIEKGKEVEKEVEEETRKERVKCFKMVVKGVEKAIVLREYKVVFSLSFPQIFDSGFLT